MQNDSIPDDLNSITFDENLLTLTEAASALPTNGSKRPSPSTIWRWCRRGLNGVHLEYLRAGRKILTSREALERFFKRLADADQDESESAGTNSTCRRPPSARERAITEAHNQLEDEGL